MAKYREIYIAKSLEVNHHDLEGKGNWKNVGTAYREVSETNGADYFTVLFNRNALPLHTDQVRLFPLAPTQEILHEKGRTKKS